MKLSIVATLYRSDPYVEEFHERVSAVAEGVAGNDYEIILVNDGSPDRSLDIAVRITKNDDHVSVIDLSRNFGHHKAMMTGLANTCGERVFLIDSDLEEDPEWLLLFHQHMQKHPEVDVVFGVQARRKGRLLEKCSGALFWSLINCLSGLSIPANEVTARLMSRRYVDALLRHEERELFIAGLWQITGFLQRSVIVNKRDKGSTTYSVGRKMSLVVNAITSSSALPLIAIFYLGVIILIFALCYTGYLIVNWVFFSYTLIGWTSLMVSVWLLGGLILSSLGIIGIYLSKVFIESKHRPYTIIRKIYGRQI